MKPFRRLTLVPAPPGTPGHDLERTLERWDAQMRAQGLAENTRLIRTGLVRRLALWCSCDPRDATADDVIRFLGQPLAASTRSTYTGQLRGWFDWLVTTGWREDHPMTGMKSPRVPRRQPRPLSEAQVRRLLATPMHTRTRTMILLGLYAGLRVSEIAGMRGELIDLDGHRIRILGKGGTDLVLPLHPVLANEAEQYPRRGWWFPSHTGNRRGRAGVAPILPRSVSDIIGDALRRAGIHATPHALRHTHATTLVRRGANMRHVQELMRHSTIATTQLYTAVDDDQLREALLTLPDWTADVS